MFVFGLWWRIVWLARLRILISLVAIFTAACLPIVINHKNGRELREQTQERQNVWRMIWRCIKHVGFFRFCCANSLFAFIKILERTQDRFMFRNITPRCVLVLTNDVRILQEPTRLAHCTYISIQKITAGLLCLTWKKVLRRSWSNTAIAPSAVCQSMSIRHSAALNVNLRTRRWIVEGHIPW